MLDLAIREIEPNVAWGELTNCVFVLTYAITLDNCI